MKQYALREHWLLAFVLAWVCALALPELLRDRIDPYDASLFAANGALFRSALGDLSAFIAHPLDWLYAYYNQYPALAVRRHPPLYGITEAIVYLFTGVSVFGAKLTALFYALAVAIGIYALSFRVWRDGLLAGATSFLFAATPQVVWLATAIRLDLPALAFGVWGLFHYVGYLQSGRRSSAVWFAILSALSVYTYQLAIFIPFGACLHLLVVRRTTVLKDRTVWLTVGVLAALILPLVIEQLYVARDNLIAASGGEVDEWKRFHPVASRWSWEFFLFYPRLWLTSYPVQSFGLVAWLLLAWRKGISREAWLLLACAGGAILFFSWMRGKEHRYAIYMMTPLVLLSALGIWQAVQQALKAQAEAMRRRIAAALIVALGMGQAYAIEVPNVTLAGMDAPVRDIMAHGGSPRILYSGPRDAAFVFYVREYDAARRASIFRASVQIEDPATLAAFVERENIDSIVIEGGDGRSGEEGFADFRRELERLVAERSWRQTGAYRLVLESRKGAKEIQLRLFQSDRAGSPGMRSN